MSQTTTIPADFEKKLIDNNIDLVFRGKKAVLWQTEQEKLVEKLQAAKSGLENLKNEELMAIVTSGSPTDAGCVMSILREIASEKPSYEVIKNILDKMESEQLKNFARLVASQKITLKTQPTQEEIFSTYQYIQQFIEKPIITNAFNLESELKSLTKELIAGDWFTDKPSVADFVETLDIHELQSFMLATLKANEFRMELLQTNS